jgi:hypothetical protein
MDHYFAKQVARQIHGINREFRSTKTPKAEKRNRLADALHFSVRYCGAPALC